MSLDVLLAVLRGVPITLLLTAAAFCFGAVVAVPLVIARVSRHAGVRVPARAAIELFRGIPPIVWLFIIYFGVAEVVLVDAMTASVVGLGVISAAYLAEIYRGSLAAVLRGQWEASYALGMTRVETVLRVVGPQVARVSIPAAASYGIGLLKDSSVAFTIGVTEVVYFATEQARVANDSLGPYLVAAGVYVLLTVPCAWGSRALDGRLRKKVMVR